MSLRLATGFSLAALSGAFFAACAFAAWGMPAWSQRVPSYKPVSAYPRKPGLAQQEVLRRLLDVSGAAGR